MSDVKYGTGSVGELVQGLTELMKEADGSTKSEAQIKKEQEVEQAMALVAGLVEIPLGMMAEVNENLARIASALEHQNGQG